MIRFFTIKRALIICLAFVVIAPWVAYDWLVDEGMGELRIVSVLIIVGFIIFLAIKYRWRYRCKKCKKFFTIQKKATYLDKTENISVIVETERRDLQGNIIGTQDQYIPGQRKRYKTPYICKHCGYDIYWLNEKDRANI
ncbi:MAG: hypothetical protein FWD90_12505 [Defluviitaleaceae bacterium]|nr:hypothetical protein [Defluviitaleaceae bacterium]